MITGQCKTENLEQTNDSIYETSEYRNITLKIGLLLLFATQRYLIPMLWASLEQHGHIEQHGHKAEKFTGIYGEDDSITRQPKNY